MGFCFMQPSARSSRIFQPVSFPCESAFKTPTKGGQAGITWTHIGPVRECAQKARPEAAHVRLDSPGVGKEAVEDAGPPVRGCQHDRLLQVVVLLLRVSCPAHDPGLHEGRPRVRQQGLDAAFIYLNTARQQEPGCASRC